METLSDIVAGMRGRGEDGRMDRHLWNEYADRIEAAAKRVVVSKTETATVGNAAALREALVWMSERMNAAVHDGSLDCYEALRKIEAALSAPARQCDVGTADEQDARFSRFCVEKRSGSCSGCPDAVGGFTVANGIRECALVWADRKSVV